MLLSHSFRFFQYHIHFLLQIILQFSLFLLYFLFFLFFLHYLNCLYYLCFLCFQHFLYYLLILRFFVLIQQHLPLRRFITSFVMLTMMIPGDLTMISIYQLNRDLHLLNTYAGLILNGLISGFSILLMRNYFESISFTLSESARIDGASELRIFSNIYMPVSLPGLATVFFMEYVARWNSITIPAAILTKESMYTLPLKLKTMILSTDSTSGTAQIPDNAIMAAIVITAAPLLLIYIFAQRFLLSGLNLGATKG